ncbi:putative oligopeptide transporter [Clavispora lusitaniae]|uniref:Oligopeptide transporter n=1 Tax=Clavispora lusitaniae TaxID=36911 RepID=A0ACD0WFT0_CLALS|nr:hypothetical protein E0198_001847 [Clavispora lusitaniae]QFZ26337.1 putative oligopeptide transporter [Clavispora lusitaniae]QFZ32005.1 putative oligopeptide transporter [Clavispora lusitaniae]QFZ37674.1 putative oligopeptide transporter [Clavispora lusitaniae]QFZ43358.1 putative oligopeptide transporter [Clavispora lusitaniae]
MPPSERSPLLNKTAVVDEAVPEELDDDLLDLPSMVRQTAYLVDNPKIHVATFRFFVLAAIFIIPGAFIDTVNSFRTTSAAYSIFFVQIAAHWAGRAMARHLPKRQVGIGRFSFNLNPGPWSVKETALVTIAAKSGATGNLATNALAMVEVYFKTRVPAAAAIGIMGAIVFVGYSYAAIARPVVSYDPQFSWPSALMQTALLRSQEEGDRSGEKAQGSESASFSEVDGERTVSPDNVIRKKSPFESGEDDGSSDILKANTQWGRDQETDSADNDSLSDIDRKVPHVHVKATKSDSDSSDTEAEDFHNGWSTQGVFFICAVALCLWQVLPEFFFPMTSSLAVLCYIAPHNEAVNFIGSGLGGMGVLNFSLDWANITSSVLLYPYWLQVVQFVGFVASAWVLIPVAKWTGVVGYKYGLMSNSLFTGDGLPYPAERLVTSTGAFNATAYAHYGPVHLGAQRSWNMFFDYAAYVSGVVWVVVFGWKQLRHSFANSRQAQGSNRFDDRLNRLNRVYHDVPTIYYMVMFLLSISVLGAVHWAGFLFVPWWTIVVALGVGSIIVTPLMWMYALTNFQLPIGTFNELLYGLLVQNQTTKHPAGAAFFGCVAGNAWYRAQHHLESMKFGFYTHLPPRLIFLAQIYGEIVGIPVNYISLRWVLASKWNYLTGAATDPLHQWTAQSLVGYHTNAIQYVVLGPARLFENYPLLPYGFVLGLVAPIIVYGLHKRFKRSPLRLELWNTTVLFSSMSHFYGNISTGYFSKFIGASIVSLYYFRHRPRLWRRYNYLVAAALDTGYNLSLTILFIVAWLGFRAPVWFGNDPRSVERCFALN